LTLKPPSGGFFFCVFDDILCYFDDRRVVVLAGICEPIGATCTSTILGLKGNNMRKNTVVIKSIIDGKRAIHFTTQPLAGNCNNVWFPIGNEELFKAIEDVMVLNRQAINLGSIHRIRNTSDTSSDWAVKYNVDGNC
jgi:hypothetical protein